MGTACSHSAGARAAIYRVCKGPDMAIGAAKRLISNAKVALGASEVSSLWDEEDTLFLPHYVTPYISPCSSINRSSPALSLPPTPGREIWLRNSETAACHPLQSLACSWCFCCFLSPLQAFQEHEITSIFILVVTLSCRVPCVPQQIRGAENVAYLFPFKAATQGLLGDTEKWVHSSVSNKESLLLPVYMWRLII